MPRRKTAAAGTTDRHDIEIHEKNPLKRIINAFLDYLKSNRKVALAGLLVTLTLTLAGVGFYAWYDYRVTKDTDRLSSIMDRYNQAHDAKQDTAAIVTELEQFAAKAQIGFPSKMSHYYLGNIYFDRGNYTGAIDQLVIFKKSPIQETFQLMAWQKIALAYEASGKFAEAMGVLKEIDAAKPGSIIADQIYYTMARVSGKMNHLDDARRYYNLVITEFPDSRYSQLAKKRLVMMSAAK